jgi:hypothetical protein
MFKQQEASKLHLGWGVHIIEGPNKAAISWTLFCILLLSFIVALAYEIVVKAQDTGFGIGQWMVAVLTAPLSGVYFDLAES